MYIIAGLMFPYCISYWSRTTCTDLNFLYFIVLINNLFAETEFCGWSESVLLLHIEICHIQ
jgi:hypothetical protein